MSDDDLDFSSDEDDEQLLALRGKLQGQIDAIIQKTSCEAIGQSHAANSENSENSEDETQYAPAEEVKALRREIRTLKAKMKEVDAALKSAKKQLNLIKNPPKSPRNLQPNTSSNTPQKKFKSVVIYLDDDTTTEVTVSLSCTISELINILRAQVASSAGYCLFQIDFNNPQDVTKLHESEVVSDVLTRWGLSAFAGKDCDYAFRWDKQSFQYSKKPKKSKRERKHRSQKRIDTPFQTPREKASLETSSPQLTQELKAVFESKEATGTSKFGTVRF